MSTSTVSRFPNIGKLSLALLEHITEPVLGTKAQELLKTPAIEKELRASLGRTLKFVEERFIAEDIDHDISPALLQLPLRDLPLINQALYDFYERPASTNLRDAITEQLNKDYPSFGAQRINNVVEKYLEILRQEIIAVSTDIREKIDSVAFQSIQINAARTQVNTLGINEGINRLVGILQTIAQPTTAGSEITYSSRLEREMRNWFEVLGYRFEKYENRKGRSFEWIINVAARRGYDRIFVYAVEGEAEMGDLDYVQTKIEELRTQEGWLVSAFRISQATRDAVANLKDRTVFCYTFDELIEESADFSGYFKWLESEVFSKGIDRTYIPLACKKQELDQNTGQLVGTSRYDEKNGWLEGYVDRWLDDPNKEHLSILGEFGMGKTWFCLHYAWSLLKKYQEAKDRGIQRPRIPLVIPLRDYAKAVSIESLFSEFFFRKYEIPIPGYSAFESLNRMGKLLLIFDGFDEMASKIDRQKMINNFWELAKALVPGSKVLLTCRTEHFPAAKEGRALLRAELKASTMNLTGEPPQFEIIELEYFNEKQIHQMLSHQADKKTIKRIMADHDLMELVRRPLMTELILDAIPEIDAGKQIDLSRVYLYAVQRKIERDIKTERTFTSLPDKLYFMCELSWEMLSSDRMTLNYREFPETLQNLFGKTLDGADRLDHWQYDMMGQTLLVRNDEGDYSPAHRSLAEFFVAYKFMAELGILHPDFIHMARGQETNMSINSAQNYTWTDYFKRDVNDTEAHREIKTLNNFLGEDTQILINSFGKERLTSVLLRFISNMLNKDLAKEQLLSMIHYTKGKSFDATRYLGTNAFEILAISFPDEIAGADFSKSNLQGLDMRHSNSIFWHDFDIAFSKTSFEKANLQGAILGNHSLENCNFRDSICNNLELGTSQLDGLSIDPKSKTIALSSHSDILLFDLESHKLIARDYAAGAWEVAYTPNAEYIVHPLYGGFCIRDAHDLKIVASFENSKFKKSELNLKRYGEPYPNLWTSGFVCTPDSSILYMGCNNSVIYIWDLVARREINTLKGHTGMIESLALNNDAGLLVSSGYNEMIVWETKNRKLLSDLKWKNTNFGNVTFHPRENVIAAVAYRNSLMLLDPYTLKPLGQIIKDDEMSIVKFSPDGTLLAFSSFSEITVLEYPSMNLVIKLSSNDLIATASSILSKGNNYVSMSIQDFVISHDNERVYVIYGSGVFGYFDLMSGINSIVNYHFPHVGGADFTGAIGLDSNLAKYLHALGAIF